MTDTEHIGQVIKGLREERKLSKKRLARESLISDAYLVQIEQGKRTPSEKVLRRLAAAMQIAPWSLLEPAGVYTPEAVATAQEFRQTIEGLSTAPRSQEDADFGYGVLLEQFSGSPLANPEFGRTKHPDDVAYEAHFHPTAEGWAELSDKDRRLVQQLINRLRYVDSEDE